MTPIRPLRPARLVFVLLGALVAGCGSPDAPPGPDGAAGAEPAAEAPPTRTHLELRTSPLVDLWFEVRAQAADVESPAKPGFEAAVSAARAVQENLGGWGGWGPLDSRVLVASDATELRSGFAEIPEPYERRGRTFSLRDDAVRLAEAIAETMPGFLGSAWPDRKAALDRHIEGLQGEFMARHPEALAYMMRSLGIEDPGVTVGVYLVTAINPPGAMTYRLYGGAQASVLEAGVGGSEALLRETILHETCHALDLASENEGSAFADLRSLLEQRGLTPHDPDWHTIPHTLMFVQAEETMRRLFDPGHVGYGEATDLYERTGEPAVVEREIWPRYLDGELDRHEALRAIVDRLHPEGVP